MNDNIVQIRRATPSGARSVQGTLALDLLPELDRPTFTPPARPHDVVPVAEEARRRLDAFAAAYLRAAVEVAIGNRPVAQMLRHTSEEVLEDLGRRAVVVRRAAGISEAHHGRSPAAVRPQVVSVRTSMVRPDAAEASAHVRYGLRSRAVAARFEVVRGRWQCTALEFA
ncbi:MAG: Rv3235 family protein [Nocardioides sp.]|uniref:Rv3235 family protein n=1 Tax=Nocardioides sp. TaxID=35761 RepID=UPI003F07B19F